MYNLSITRFDPTFLEKLDGFSTGTWSMVKVTSGTDVTNAASDLAISSLTQLTTSLVVPTYTNQTLTYSLYYNI